MGNKQYLTSLNLSHVGLGDHGGLPARVVAPGLAAIGPRLTELNLGHTISQQLGTRTAYSILNALVPAVTSMTQLRRLTLVNAHLPSPAGVHLMHALSNAQGLTELDLSGAQMDPDTEAALWDLVASVKHLRRLDLSATNLTYEGIRLGTSIEWLDLSVNDLGAFSEALARLVHALRALRQLRHLSLAANALDDEELDVLAPVVATLPKLESLNLSANHLGPESAPTLAQLIRALGGHLTELNLGGNFLGGELAGDGQAVDLAAPAPAEAMGLVAPALAEAKHLRTLDLSSTALDQGDSARALAAALTNMPALEHLVLSGNDVRRGRTGALRALRQALRHILRHPETYQLRRPNLVLEQDEIDPGNVDWEPGPAGEEDDSDLEELAFELAADADARDTSNEDDEDEVD